MLGGTNTQNAVAYLNLRQDIMIVTIRCCHVLLGLDDVRQVRLPDGVFM